MTTKHLFLVIFIMIIFGSAYPVAKLTLNSSVPPILLGALRNLIFFICLIPFCKFRIPKKIFFLPLFGFSFSFGVGVILFMNLALKQASLISPIIIGSQLSVPCGIIFSSLFLKEFISIKKWILILTSFIGILFIGLDPKLVNDLYALFFTFVMAFFYGLAQVFSRYLKELDLILITTCMTFIGFITLLFFSIIFEGNSIKFLTEINFETWLLILHSGIIVSILGHMSMFYLYKFYPVDKVLPFYSLLPIFGILLSFFIFFEIPGFFEIVGGIIVIGSIYSMHIENK